MKTKLFLIVSLAITLLLSSCQKEEAYSLDGTTWETTPTSAGIVQTFEFQSSSCTLYLKLKGIAYETSPYDYVLNYPKVMMYAKQSGMANLEGTINGTTLSVKNISKDVYLDPFYRK